MSFQSQGLDRKGTSLQSSGQRLGADALQGVHQRDLDRIEPLARLPEAMRFEMRVVSTVLPFR